MDSKSFIVLMAEDSEHDIVATKRAWKKSSIINTLNVVRDGEECLDYLYRRGAYSDPETSPRPGVLLLDLHMPKVNGLDVLREIRADKAFKSLPVVVLTTSKADEDKVESYNLGVNAYIVKPVGFEKFSEAIRTIHMFWKLVELPG
jgi:CheY-like chemotaxis protein